MARRIPFAPAIILVICILVSSALPGCTDDDGGSGEETVEPGFIIQFNRTKGLAPMSVSLVLVNVTGKLETFRWEYGDDSAESFTDPSEEVSHTYSRAGRYAATVEVEFEGSEFIKRTVIIHASHRRTITSTLSITEEESYYVPIEDAAADVRLELRYQGGQEVGGIYQNGIDMYLYLPNGTLYGSTEEQIPTSGEHVKTLSVTYQYLAAALFEDWECTFKAKSGLSVEYDYTCEVDY